MHNIEKMFSGLCRILFSGKVIERHFKRLRLSFFKLKTAAVWPFQCWMDKLNRVANNWNKGFLFKALMTMMV